MSVINQLVGCFYSTQRVSRRISSSYSRPFASICRQWNGWQQVKAVGPGPLTARAVAWSLSLRVWAKALSVLSLLYPRQGPEMGRVYPLADPTSHCLLHFENCTVSFSFTTTCLILSLPTWNPLSLLPASLLPAPRAAPAAFPAP
jgi:hypothetical protein